ncbi:hypothetical protein J6590_088659 [Homalodisca vitripennis]|nr:hypothetical protein J6590_088659 [Homalodisca vitripennis]
MDAKVGLCDGTGNSGTGKRRPGTGVDILCPRIHSFPVTLKGVMQPSSSCVKPSGLRRNYPRKSVTDL